MTERRRRAFLAALMAILVFSVVLADFHHSERTCKADPTCPACRLQGSSLTASTVVFFQLPGLRFLSYVEPQRAPAEIEAAALFHSSRAPPQA
jgi:hypothetical protein